MFKLAFPVVALLIKNRLGEPADCDRAALALVSDYLKTKLENAGPAWYGGAQYLVQRRPINREVAARGIGGVVTVCPKIGQSARWRQTLEGQNRGVPVDGILRVGQLVEIFDGQINADNGERASVSIWQ